MAKVRSLALRLAIREASDALTRALRAACDDGDDELAMKILEAKRIFVGDCEKKIIYGQPGRDGVPRPGSSRVGG